MAKMSRRALKSLIKECVVEILQEGLGFDDFIAESVAQPRRERKSMGLGRPDRPPKRRKRQALGYVCYSSRRPANHERSNSSCDSQRFKRSQFTGFVRRYRTNDNVKSGSCGNYQGFTGAI